MFSIKPQARQTAPLPSESSEILAKRVEAGDAQVTAQVLGHMVRKVDVIEQLFTRWSQYQEMAIASENDFREFMKVELKEIKDQLPSAFIKRIWFPVTLALIISMILAWLGLK